MFVSTQMTISRLSDLISQRAISALALPFIVLALLAEAPQKVSGPVDTGWSILKDGVGDKSSDKRAKAVIALGLLPHNVLAQTWAEAALKDDSSDVRASAATALGKMDAVSAKSKLREALKDKDVKVVIAAADTLYQFKDPAAYDVFYALLTGERKSSTGLLQSQIDILKNRKELEQLAFQTGMGFVPFGGMGYQAWKTITHDASTPVRAIAAEKLASDPDQKSGKALYDATSNDKWQIRAAAVDALNQRGDPSLLAAVVSRMYDSNDTVRFYAAAAVINLSGHRNTRHRIHRG
jgi:HEAT repeat protein